MGEFLQRAYRVVIDEASDHDLQLTFIHACLAHVMAVSVIIYLFYSALVYYIGYEKNC